MQQWSSAWTQRSWWLLTTDGGGKVARCTCVDDFTSNDTELKLRTLTNSSRRSSVAPLYAKTPGSLHERGRSRRVAGDRSCVVMYRAANCCNSRGTNRLCWQRLIWSRRVSDVVSARIWKLHDLTTLAIWLSMVKHRSKFTPKSLTASENLMFEPAAIMLIDKSTAFSARRCCRNSVRGSVRLSDACIVTKLNEGLRIFTAITLVLWHQQRLVSAIPFPPKSALKVTHPLRKTPTSTDFCS